MIKKVFFDVETTGLSCDKHSIHQLAGLIELDGEVVEEFNYFMRPHERAKVEPAALKVSGISEAEVRAYPPMSEAYDAFTGLLSKYINKYDKKDKAYLVGFNSRYFDEGFLRMLFLLHGDNYFNSWFWGDTLDTMVLASQYLIDRRPDMLNFKLGTVAAELGVFVQLKTSLHDALYDAQTTREIYRIVTGLDVEL